MRKAVSTVCFITLPFMLASACSQSSSSDASTRTIFSVYAGTVEAVIVEQFENWALLEVRENVPPHLSDKQASSFFLVWEQDSIEPLLYRASRPDYLAFTSIGCFRIEILTNILAMRPESKQRGMLVGFSFNPEEKGSGFSPLPKEYEVVLRTAIQNSSLTDVQRKRIERRLRTYRGLLDIWNEFKRDPYDSDKRKALLNAICESDLDFLRVVGSPFYSREQRIALRKAGCTIRGGRYGGTSDGVQTTNLRDFPLSELVSEWNGCRGFLGLPTDRPAIAVSEARKHDEIDLVIKFNTSDSPHQRMEKALKNVTEIEGIYRQK